MRTPAMYLGLCFFGVIASVWAIAAFATSTKAGQSGQPGRPGPRDQDRRSAQLRACPDRATILDLETLLRAHPLPERTVARVLGIAAERRISSRTLWCWADRFGADKLVLAIDADVAERRLQRHLDAVTTPDWSALEIFASLNEAGAAGGMPFSEIVDLDEVPPTDSFDLTDWETPAPDTAVPMATDADLSQFDHLPPIYDPGLPVTQTVAPPAGAGGPGGSAGGPGGGGGPDGPKHGGDDPWPMVA